VSIVTLNQFLAFAFSVVAVYYSFRDLNACGPWTAWYVRYPLVFMFAASLVVLLAAVMGMILSWMTTIVMASLAVKLATERRRDNPFINSSLRQQHNLQKR
jgi:hypothetical protein